MQVPEVGDEHRAAVEMATAPPEAPAPEPAPAPPALEPVDEELSHEAALRQLFGAVSLSAAYGEPVPARRARRHARYRAPPCRENWKSSQAVFVLWGAVAVLGGLVAAAVFWSFAVEARPETYDCRADVKSSEVQTRCWVEGCAGRVRACPYTNCEDWGLPVPGTCCGDYYCDGKLGPCGDSAGQELRELCTVACGPREVYELQYTAPSGAYLPVSWWCSPAESCTNETVALAAQLLPRRCYQTRADVRHNRVRLSDPQEDYMLYVLIAVMSVLIAGAGAGIAFFGVLCSWTWFW